MPALVLLSGGMDSTIALFHTLEQGDAPVHALTFHYGQRHAAEVKAAGDVIAVARQSHRGVGEHRIVNLTGVMPLVGSLMLENVPVRKYAQDQRDFNGHEPSFIPHRNMLFLTVAATWARHLGAHKIVTGLRGGFSDCTKIFENAVELVLGISDVNFPLSIESPVHSSRADCVKIAKSIPGCMVALAQSLTCFEGTTPPCGSCLPCVKRARGFAASGVQDPILGPARSVLQRS